MEGKSDRNYTLTVIYDLKFTPSSTPSEGDAIAQGILTHFLSGFLGAIHELELLRCPSLNAMGQGNTAFCVSRIENWIISAESVYSVYTPVTFSPV